MKSKVILSIFGILLCVLAAACSSAGKEEDTGPAEESEGASENVAEVLITEKGYDPQELTIKVGTTVTWTNTDATPHSATSDTGVWDTGIFTKGKSASYTFETAGTYPYHCSYRISTKGTIIVTE